MRNGRYCPLQQGFAPCTDSCAWYDAMHGRCELVNMADALSDIAEHLERLSVMQTEDRRHE